MGDGVRLAAVKALHTLVLASVEVCMAAILSDALRQRAGRTTAVAAAVVGAEMAVFLGNGAKCPMTSMAARYHTGPGPVSDIYLPGWVARNVTAFHLPLIVLAVRLHVLRGSARPRQVTAATSA